MKRTQSRSACWVLTRKAAIRTWGDKGASAGAGVATAGPTGNPRAAGPCAAGLSVSRGAPRLQAEAPRGAGSCSGSGPSVVMSGFHGSKAGLGGRPPDAVSAAAVGSQQGVWRAVAPQLQDNRSSAASGHAAAGHAAAGHPTEGTALVWPVPRGELARLCAAPAAALAAALPPARAPVSVAAASVAHSGCGGPRVSAPAHGC